MKLQDPLQDPKFIFSHSSRAFADMVGNNPITNQEIIMNTTSIYISSEDHSKLRLLLSAALRSNATASLHKLREELDRAIVVEPSALPDDVVTMGSTVQFEDLGSGEVEEYTLTFPDQANIEQKRLSILAPIGTALIGFRVGDVVNWTTPGGVRQLKLHRVTQSHAAASKPSASPLH